MPVQFTCPYCGRQTEVDDRFVGVSGPCAGCGKTVTVPDADGARPPEPQQESKSALGPGQFAPPQPLPARSGTSGWGIALIVVVGLVMLAAPMICVMAALLLPAIQAARESARTLACKNNLREISLAIMRYHSEKGELPPSYIPDADGQPMHSWRVLILPYLEDPKAQNVYQEYDFSEPWNGPHNRLLADRMPEVFRCPSAPTEDGQSRNSLTSYMVVTGGKAAFQPAVKRKKPAMFGNAPSGNDPMARWQSQTDFASLVDGRRNTVGVVEVAGGHVNWMEPKDLSFEKAIGGTDTDRQGNGLSSWHPTLVNVMLLDGSVRGLKKDASSQMLERLIDRQDGQPIDWELVSR